MANKTADDTNIFIVFSKKLFEHAQLFKGIIAQKNNTIQLYEEYFTCTTSFHIRWIKNPVIRKVINEKALSI